MSANVKAIDTNHRRAGLATFPTAASPRSTSLTLLLGLGASAIFLRGLLVGRSLDTVSSRSGEVKEHRFRGGYSERRARLTTIGDLLGLELRARVVCKLQKYQ